MTKEEILHKNYFDYYRPDFPSDKRTTEVVAMALGIKEEVVAIHRSMDEYAKQQATEYCSWYNSIGFLAKVKNDNDYIEGESHMKDHDQLYKEFIEQQNKTNKMSEQNIANAPQRELTFGEKAAGVTFNPGGHPAVDSVKSKFAIIIDELNSLRHAAASGEAKRYYSKAISHAEDAQMNAVKAITWQH